MDISIMTKPVVGAIIGYSTNWLAIKMLFKPHTAKYIGRIRIPFTPGLIPKERERIARSLGTAVGERLLTDEVISKELLDDKVIAHIKTYVIRDLLSQDMTTATILKKIFGDDYDVMASKVGKSLHRFISDQFQSEITRDQIKTLVTTYLTNTLAYNTEVKSLMPEDYSTHLEDILSCQKDKISQFIVEESKSEVVVSKLKEIVGALIMEKVGALGAMFVNPDDVAVSILDYLEKTVFEETFQEGMIKLLLKAAEQGTNVQISDVIPPVTYNNMIDSGTNVICEHAFNMAETMDLKPYIDEGLETLLNKPIHLTEKDKEKIEVQVEFLYRQFVETHIGTFLETFELKSIVESEVNAFSVKDIENLIFTIVDKELKAITWFGALLGFVMGITMIFI